MDRKTKGNLGEAKALTYLVQNEYEVFLPFSDNGSVDLIAIKDKKIYRVSVKSTSSQNESGSWAVTIKTVSRRKDTVVVNLFDKTNVDKVLVYVIPEDRIVEIEASDIVSKHQLNIPGRDC